MQYYAFGQTDSTSYKDFSKAQLQTYELQQIARILPQAESYYYQSLQKDSINAELNKIIRDLSISLSKYEMKEQLYKKLLELKDKEIDIVKPKWWQNPIVIITEVAIAFITGLTLTK